MNIKLLAIGKTDKSEIQSLTGEYISRIKHYINFDMEIIPDLKNRKALSENDQKIKEGELILKHIEVSDVVVLLDERGKLMSSVEFAGFLQKKMNRKVLLLVVQMHP